MADRSEYVLKTTEVTHIAKPYGANRTNPPTLWDLRRFVEACEGLPDNMAVMIKPEDSDNTGRRNVVFSVKKVDPVTDEMIEAKANKLDWFKRKPNTEETQ
jgi:hypothetical protein